MPRQLAADMTLDALEDEVIYTQSALRADPDATDLITLTADWFPQIDAVRAADRSLRETIGNTDASRMVANQRLDSACIVFGRELLYDVGNDRSSPRWTQFFKVAPAQFVRQALSKQVTTIRGWLAGATDPVLDAHRTTLSSWSTSADVALVNTQALATLRGQQWQLRSQLTSTLTQSRDALHRMLAQRAQERKLDRDWPDVFFRTDTRASEREASSNTNGTTTNSTSSGGTASTGTAAGTSASISAAAPVS